jgi:HD superfamily phosphohydrolase
MHDYVHGNIEIPELCKKFRETPEFERLIEIKMGGHIHHVYPEAKDNTRYDHCTGVMHLAGKMVRHLRSEPSIEISERTEHLIMLGGLLHDIGHRAYSHLYDEFLKHTSEHEERSVTSVRSINSYLQLLTEEEEQFVANVIMGKAPNKRDAYLYEIVCNELCGVDVDKMDYLMRDSHHTTHREMRFDRIIENVRIHHSGHIAFARETKSDIDDLFKARQYMYEEVYHHPGVRIRDKISLCATRRATIAGIALNSDTDNALEEQLNKYAGDIFEKIHDHDPHHDCDVCADYKLEVPIRQSGKTSQVIFV